MTYICNNEIREIYGYPGYFCTRDGRIRGISGKWLSPSLSCGYLIVSATVNGKPKILKVHRAVLLAWIGPPPPGMQACHWPDTNRSNNNLSNLRWDTHTANMRDAVKSGTHMGCLNKGENNFKAKLTRENVYEIRSLLLKGEKTQAQIAEIYKINQTTVSAIKRGKLWGHLG